LIVKNNLNIAITNHGTVFTWGHFPKGLNCEPKDVSYDRPKPNSHLQGFGFKQIKMTKDSAVAVGKSVELKFEIPEHEEASTQDQISNLKSIRSNLIKQKSQIQTNKTVVTIHAIPVIDGQLISSEIELMGCLGDKEMKVDLISDFEVAWLDFVKPYPKY